MTDAELVAVARLGDRSAFAALVERHHAALLAACRGDEDAAQEAVLTALLALDRLRDPETFGSWLAGIGRNLRRRRPRRRPTLDDLLGGRVAAPAADELAAAAERAARVRRAVAALPPGQRAAVALSYFAGLSHAEVAAHLRTRPGAVKARLHKARATLRRALHEEAPIMPDVPVVVSDVRRTPGPPPRHVIVLEGEAVSLPIWIGEPDARALAATLRGVELPRPGSHQLTAGLLKATGRRLERVRVVRLTDDVFYAETVLDDGTAVDARPSDALHLALVVGAPISVARDVLDATSEPDELTAALIADLEAAADGAAVLADEVRAAL